MRRLAISFAGILVVVALVGYVGVAYEIASGVTKAERHTFEDTPGANHLAYEAVTFPLKGQGSRAQRLVH